MAIFRLADTSFHFAEGRIILMNGGTALYPLSNTLIEALPEPLKQKLVSSSTRIKIPLGTSLYEPNQAPRSFHFLTSGIASVVTTTGDGRTTEIGTLGREGAPQAVHLLGSAPVPTRCFMQVAGTGLRIEFSRIQRLFESDVALRKVLLAYVQYQAVMLGQVAGCNRLHNAESRLARWLLMIQDRTAHSILKLTQEFLAEMIGSQRTTVSEVAAGLQERGLIDYVRGTIRIVDRVGLENAACDCYPITRSLLAAVYSIGAETLFQG